METLLTPAESLAFQSFLSSVDTSQPSSDWAAYASQFNPEAIRKHNDDILVDSLPSPQENDPLTKATKDLMSLDNGVWGDNGMALDHAQLHQPSFYSPLAQVQPSQPQDGSHSLPIQSPQPVPFPTAHDAFPFLNSKAQHLQRQDQYQHQQYLPERAQSFDYQNQGFHQGQQLNASSFPNSQSHPQPQQVHPHHPPPISRTHTQSSIPSSSAPAKRPIRPISVSRASSSSSPSATAGPSTSKRSAGAQSRSSASQSPHPSGQPSKPALLSPSQKKANHIQSEQKRRANIRRGYEALCETVPALREAIREEEEEAKAVALAAAAGLSNGKGKASKKRNSGKKKEGDDIARDKIDGRAGPRSENVVLSKTIDYINELLADKAALLSRLQRARSALPPGHPARASLSPNPPWEREWKGGEGKEGEDGEGDEESDAEGEENDDVESANPNNGKSRTRKRGKDSE